MPEKIVKQMDELKAELQQSPVDTTPLELKLKDAQETGLERFTPDALQALSDSLRAEADAFEVEHPQIAALINQIATALSNLGI